MWAVGARPPATKRAERERRPLPPEERRTRTKPPALVMAAGAHYVVDSTADCEPVLDEKTVG